MATWVYSLIWWGLFITAAIFAVMDIVRGKEDTSDKDNTVWICGEVIAMIAIFLIVAKGMFTLEQYSLANENQVTRVIALTLIVMPFRRILDILIYGIVMYLLDVDNSFRQHLEQKLIVTNSVTGKKTLSTGVLRLYHLVMYIASLVIYALCAAFPGVARSRLNVIMNTFGNVGKLVTGSTGQQMLFMIWLISLLVLITVVIIYLIKLYKNYIHLVEKEYNDIDDISKIRWFAIIMFILRKIFIYIFIMDNYRLQDTLFWWIVILMVGSASLCWYLYNQRRGNTVYHIA